MDEKIYEIILADGTVIENLRLNGNNYISSVVISSSVFTNNCSPVVISDGLNNETHDNMELVQVTEVNGECWFVLRDISAIELKQLKLQSDIEYVAMMSGIEL